MKIKITYIPIILAVTLGIFGLWSWQRNSYSKDTLKLEILGPSMVDFAKEFDYAVKYKNNGTVRLEEVWLSFDYPEHAILEQGKTSHQEIALEDIYPGEEKTTVFKAKLIGQEGDILTARASINFKPKNLNANYQSETSFTSQMKALPLNFELDIPSQLDPGKNFKFRINYFSNIDYPLTNLRITTEYPDGFEFISSNPNALEKTEWDILPLNKAQGGRIEITGKLNGNIGEQKIFGTNIGIWRNGEFILLKEADKGVGITNPDLEITQQINGSSNYVASPGDQLHYEISFKNVGQDPLTSLTLADTLSGDILDFTSLIVPNGNFTIGDNSIIWDWKTIGMLQYLGPQRQGKVEFWIKLKSDFEIPGTDGNISIQNSVYLNQIKEDFTTKVNSKLEAIQRGLFHDEVFGNSGPIPPQVGQQTTYTIIWQAKNYYNQVKNVKVKAILPQNVQLTGKIFPEDSRLTFDSQSREIVWEVGDMQIGQGVLNPAPNVSFQVALTPTGFQIGQMPDIIGQAKITGEDVWTGLLTSGVVGSINTSLSDDSSVNHQGIVR